MEEVVNTFNKFFEAVGPNFAEKFAMEKYNCNLKEINPITIFLKPVDEKEISDVIR